MTTQSLRGMANHGPMHWRGDRTGGNDASSAQPDSGSFNEAAGFMKFNPAFQDLLGSAAQPSTADMQAFADFALQLTYPPNPIRNLDNSFTSDQQAGQNFFLGITNNGLAFRHAEDLQRLPCAGSRRQQPVRRGAPRLLRHRWTILVRKRDAALQDPPPAQLVSKGGKIRRCRRIRSFPAIPLRSWAIRCAASDSCTMEASTP